MRGRSLVQAVIHQSVTCRRFEGASFATPPPPSLPVSRVKEEPAFSFTGVDLAGPLIIRTKGPNKTSKAYLFCNKSCAPRYCVGHVYRDIHLVLEEACCLKGIASNIYIRQWQDI